MCMHFIYENNTFTIYMYMVMFQQNMLYNVIVLS